MTKAFCLPCLETQIDVRSTDNGTKGTTNDDGAYGELMILVWDGSVDGERVAFDLYNLGIILVQLLAVICDRVDDVSLLVISSRLVE